METLRHFAKIYQATSAGKSGSSQHGYRMDYEKFLRLAGLADGDEREIAEQELLAAESLSGGLFRIDRHSRTREPQLIRLSKEGGEAWLFEQIGGQAPTVSRRELAAFFESSRDASVAEPWQERWREWFDGLAQRAANGESIHPFRRDDEDGNRTLLAALAGVLCWQGEALVRYASTAICGDSKALQIMEPRLRPALAAITGHASLEAFGILRKPRAATIHGPLVLHFGKAALDFSKLPAPCSLSEANLTQASVITTLAPLCLTVENEDVFHELARRQLGILLVQTSYVGAATLHLLRSLPADLPCHHFGDSDPAGWDILRDLSERSGRSIQPLLMNHRPQQTAQPLSAKEQKLLESMLQMDLLQDLHDDLSRMLASGSKGNFEQEAIPIEDVILAIDQLRQMAE